MFEPDIIVCMEETLKNKSFNTLLTAVKIFIIATFSLFFVYMVLNFVFNATKNTLTSDKLIITTNHYLELLINSWPSSILVLGIILLITQQKSIADFIGKRMTYAGPQGLKGALTPQEGALVLDKQGVSDSVLSNTETVSTKDMSVPTSIDLLGVGDLHKQNKVLIQHLNFEKIHNNIFGTQLALLGSMRTDILGIYYKTIASVYEGWRENDEVLKNYALDDYLNFLILWGLVVLSQREGERAYIITDEGLDFLNYIESNKYPTKDH